MKKTIIIISMLAIVSILVACGKTAAATQTTTGSSNALSAQTELLVGTFKLEDTDLAVTSEQAKQLLPLWQTLQSLSNSGTAATEETDAIVNQIKGSMTAEQMTKITEMKLTQQDIMSVMSQAGVFSNNPATTTTPMAMGNFPSGRPQGGGPGSGGMPSGGGEGGMVIVGSSNPPSDGGGFVINGNPGMAGGFPDASTTPQAGRPNMSNRVPAPLLNALIELLQKKVQ
jgi:hypothetical protein